MHWLPALLLVTGPLTGLVACTPAQRDSVTPAPTATAQTASASVPPTSAPARTAPALPAPAPASPIARACRATGGIWSRTGTAAIFTCLQPTPDANAPCRRQSDCDGLCLARSRTCAPVKPLFGCNDIVQDDGTEATLCLD